MKRSRIREDENRTLSGIPEAHRVHNAICNYDKRKRNITPKAWREKGDY